MQGRPSLSKGKIDMSRRRKVLITLGTRPEAIKLAPLIKALQHASDAFEVRVCSTGQHREMLDQVFELFDIAPEYDLRVMEPNQTLFGVSAKILLGFEEVVSDFEPDVIFVQGDTATTLFGALGGFYQRVKIAHLEAGLRSGNKWSPFPEEINRILVSRLADLHFTVTRRNSDALRAEGIHKGIFEVGNTVIDALYLCLKKIEAQGDEAYRSYFHFVNFDKKVVLVTGHRRESFGRPFEALCEALVHLREDHEDIEIVYPAHLNPNVQEPVKRLLGNREGIHLIAPLDYPYLIWLLSKSYMVLTDSGGIQEEAPSLGKPVLVLREVTERIEGIEAGTALLVGTSPDRIEKEAARLLTDPAAYQSMAASKNPYGDGSASQQVVQVLRELPSLAL